MPCQFGAGDRVLEHCLKDLRPAYVIHRESGSAEGSDEKDVGPGWSEPGDSFAVNGKT